MHLHTATSFPTSFANDIIILCMFPFLSTHCFDMVALQCAYVLLLLVLMDRHPMCLFPWTCAIYSHSMDVLLLPTSRVAMVSIRCACSFADSLGCHGRHLMCLPTFTYILYNRSMHVPIACILVPRGSGTCIPQNQFLENFLLHAFGEKSKVHTCSTACS